MIKKNEPKFSNCKVKLNKITTKTGDFGETLGPGNKKYKKHDLEIEILGQLDKLNCSIGNVILHEKSRIIKALLTVLQNQIFDIGAAFFKNIDIDNNYIEFLESKIEFYNQNLPELSSFLLPQGTAYIVALHLSRCQTRETERFFWRLYWNLYDKNNFDSKNICIYLNRLSDLFFILIRKKLNQ